MKALLLLVAVYALIINQALKQVDSKPSVRVKNDKKKNQQSSNNMYINASLSAEAPFTESEIRHMSGDKQLPVLPAYLFQREADADILKPQNLLYPVSYPYPVNLDKRRS